MTRWSMTCNGHIEQPDKAVLARDDYERYHLSHGPFIAALETEVRRPFYS